MREALEDLNRQELDSLVFLRPQAGYRLIVLKCEPRIVRVNRRFSIDEASFVFAKEPRKDSNVFAGNVSRCEFGARKRNQQRDNNC
jgi:hypothetical protein